MRDVLSPFIHSPVLPPPPKSNMPMLYYGLVVVGTAALVLAIYNLIVIRWCTHRYQGRPRQRPRRFVEVTAASQSFENMNRNLLASFKYKKEGEGKDQGNDFECVVCLSVFEEGEEVRQLPGCNHTFHAPCIDMWLFSHSDCPLCRAHVDLTLPCQHSRQGLLDSGVSV